MSRASIPCFTQYDIHLVPFPPQIRCGCNNYNSFTVAGALMSAIDEGDKDEDGFLRMIYSGDRALGSVERLPVRTSVN